MNSVWTTVALVIIIWVVYAVLGTFTSRVGWAGVMLILLAALWPPVGALIGGFALLLLIVRNPQIFSGGIAAGFGALKGTFTQGS